ncbi:MAG: decaprenyl-phosphate phosphoribosyltransferase [Mucilaginibacter polytrichastri]|nr:decaprenyl-phosphate phosphoribosyltransferase [Mucilaginibacter polytrichastri]
MLEAIKLLRPQQWIKNTFLFLPAFFAGYIGFAGHWVLLIGGFVSFSLTASAVYVLNDYRDREADRLHPEKSKRPIASGKIGPKTALVLFAVLIIAGLGIAALLKMSFFFISLIYLFVNILYSFGLKNVSIIDIMIVAVGFNLRLKGGGLLVDVSLSSWMTIMVFLLSLFIAVGKRRDDILIKDTSGKVMRKSLAGYNIEFLNAWLGILAGVIIVAYIMYAQSPESMHHMGSYRLYYTMIFVIAGLMRYMQLVYIDQKTGSPIKILYTDRFLQLVLILWIVVYFIIIYLPGESIFGHL